LKLKSKLNSLKQKQEMVLMQASRIICRHPSVWMDDLLKEAALDKDFGR